MSKKYNQIEVKDNMKVEGIEQEEVSVKEKRELKSVVSEKPTKVKRGLISRLVTGIVGPDGLPGIGSYVNDEIVKPALRNIIYEGIESAVRMAIFRDGGGPGPNRGGRHTPYSGGSRHGHRPTTNYGANYRSSSSDPVQPERVVRTARQGIEEYLIGDRYDAAHVLTTLTENADMYGSVSVADYYDLIGVPSQYTDNNHGWTLDSISRASVLPVRGGYVIKFPPLEVI